jgi:hypothetical protein
MRAREMLNKIKWHPDYDENEYYVIYLHRGAPKDERSVPFSSIQSLCTSDFMLLDKDGIEIYIPYHRVKRIVDCHGGAVWKKRGN